MRTCLFKFKPTKLSEISRPRPILLEWNWKTSPAKSAGFRIQLLSAENRRYHKEHALNEVCKLTIFFPTNNGKPVQIDRSAVFDFVLLMDDG